MKKLEGIRALLPYLAREKGTLILIALLSALSAMSALLPSLMIGALVDSLTGRNPRIAPLSALLSPEAGPMHYVAVFIASYVLWRFVSLIYGPICSAFSDRIIERVRSDAYAGALRTLETHRGAIVESDVTSRLSGDVEWITRAVAGPLNAFVPEILKLCFALWYLFHLDARVAACCIVTALPLYFLSRRIAQTAKTIARQQRESQARLVGVVEDVVRALSVVRVYGTEEREDLYFAPYNREIRTLSRKMTQRFSLYWAAVYGCMTLGLGAGVALVARGVLEGAATAGTVTIAFSYMSNVFGPMITMSRYGSDIFQADAALARVFELQSAGRSVPRDPEPKDTPISLENRDAAPAVVFDDVSIRLGETSRLESVSFTAHPNTITALSGESGIGKTSLLCALLGLRRFDEGSIHIAGSRYDPQNPPQARDHRIGVLLQDACLFDRSFEDNIAYGEEKPDYARIDDLTFRLGLRPLIAERGYRFDVGASGKNLSGGQQRRAAIARACYADRTLYVFDEPTAELDDESRTKVISFLRALSRRATVILSTHDEDLLRAADQVISMKQYFHA